MEKQAFDKCGAIRKSQLIPTQFIPHIYILSTAHPAPFLLFTLFNKIFAGVRL